MAFHKYVCWDISRVRQVMKTDAEHASRHVFLSVHSEYPLIVSSPRHGTVEGDRGWTIPPQDFLHAFLSKDNPHMQVAVLGDSGSGKSHFISWMKYSLPESADRYTIAIPRTGVSLRGVLERLINALPEAVRQPYLDELNRSGSQHSSPQHLEERLLSEIALAIQGDDVRGNGDPDLENELVKILPSVFHDPILRGYFRQSGGMVQQLATQVLSESNEYLPAEDRREFSTGDLPLSGAQTAGMSSIAKDTCVFLGSNQESQQLAVDIINRNLNRAIGQVLNFSGDRLIRLLQDVRRHLRDQGRELVLLIEDLARLQGLDLSLLEALIEEGNQQNGLCELRWAAAVTTGYYTRLPNTVHTRMSYVFRMDLPTNGEDGSIGVDDIVGFAAKYLNSSRVTDEELVAWADLPEVQRENAPNACASCEHRTDCHSAFGAHDGVGLYPFNKDSLINMLRRQDNRFDQRFNPRVLVKDVLAEVLGTYGDDLTSGRFPSQFLLNQMQGPHLPPMVRDQLRQQNPEQADRQLAILELWGKSNTQPADLAEELYTAFGIVKPRLQGTLPPPEPDTAKELDPRRPKSVELRVVEAIRAWGNGSTMQDALANTLRPMVFDSILSTIDWDMAGLVQSFFAGTSSGLFRRDSISFARQLTQAQRRPVTLIIPHIDGQQGLDDAAIALEGLYLFSRYGHWDFPRGRDHFAAYANCLEEWSAEVLGKIQSFKTPHGRWNVHSAAVEMLTVGAAMAGKAPRQRSDEIGWLNALFGDWPVELPARSLQWQGLYREITRERNLLMDFVRAMASGSKGGQRGQFIDPTALSPALRRVRGRWDLSGSPPDAIQNQQNQFGRLSRLHNKIRTELAAVASAEWHQSTDWVNEWHDKFGEDTTGQEAINEIRGLLDLALNGGISFSGSDRQAVETALTELEGAHLDNSLRRAARLLAINEPLKLLPTLGEGRSNRAGDAVSNLLPALNQLLDRLETSVASRELNSDTIESELQAHQARIESALKQLISGLKVMEESHVQAD